MLPGFRFLFAAIVLTMSILVFGLGAAALLRAAHEEFAANPSWRVPEPRFAQQDEAPIPVLAMLRLEPDPSEQKPSDGIAAAAPAEPPATAAGPTEPEKIAALNPQDSGPPQAAKPEIPAAEPPAQGASAPAEAPASADETRIATAAQTLPPTDEAPAPEQAAAPAAAETDIAAPKIATLGDPPVAIEAEASAKAASAKPDPSVVKKRQQARRTAQRRRAAQRARLAQQVAAQQQAADPFAQPTTNIRSR